MLRKQIAGGFALIALAANPDPAVAQCEVAELTAADAASGDRFGYSVSVSGDYAVVGAWIRGGLYRIECTLKH